MHINAAGLTIIKESEGLHLKAYQDAGQWLIGYGHADGAGPGKTISAARAEEFLKQDVAACESTITSALSRNVTSNQFSALVSLCYNIGTQRLAQSTLLKRLNRGDVTAAADGFLDWTKGTVGGEKVVLPRLEARRQKERGLFLAAS
jgi:GH24 family phage-related lysozyme (muramidase)